VEVKPMRRSMWKANGMSGTHRVDKFSETAFDASFRTLIANLKEKGWKVRFCLKYYASVNSEPNAIITSPMLFKHILL
jgi:hypothetical protein